MSNVPCPAESKPGSGIVGMKGKTASQSKKRGRKPKPKNAGASSGPSHVPKRRRTKPTPTIADAVQQVGIFWTIEELSAKSFGILEEIHAYFTPRKIKALLLPYICDDNENGSSVSGGDTAPRLRVLDWLVTNWSKKTNEIIYDPQSGNPPLNINEEYKSMLRYFGRKNFDVFRRRQRIYFEWKEIGKSAKPQETEETKVLETTVGQLNFMYWLDTTRILAYAQRNWTIIAEDMRKTIDANKKRKQKKKFRRDNKRYELSKAPSRPCHIMFAPGIMRFDSDSE